MHVNRQRRKYARHICAPAQQKNPLAKPEPVAYGFQLRPVFGPVVELATYDEEARFRKSFDYSGSGAQQELKSLARAYCSYRADDRLLVENAQFGPHRRTFIT